MCKLRKAIYSLKQSSRTWFDKFNKVVIATSFPRFHFDHSVSIRCSSSESVVLIVYTDDIKLIGSDSRGIEEVKEYLKKYFITKDMGLSRYFLGIEIAHNRQ